MAAEIRKASAQTVSALPTGWRVLDRDTNFSRVAGKGGHRGLRLSFLHQPHLVNYVDLQRLLQLIAPGQCTDRSIQRINFSPECAGLGQARRDHGHYLEAYQYFCRVDIVTP